MGEKGSGGGEEGLILKKNLDALYSDGLITITQDTVEFHNYYFPWVSKIVPVSDIEKITSSMPSIFNGKWRLWGGGGFGHWFTLDIKRPSRDRIFFARLKNKDFVIGFTVKDSANVENILREMNLLQ